MPDATRRSWIKTSGAVLAPLASQLPFSSIRPAAARVGSRDGAPAGAMLAGAAPASAIDAIRVRLSLNENPFGCSPAAVEAIRNNLAGLSRYTERDAEQLTAQIAAKEGVSPQQVVLGEVLPALGTQLSVTGGPGGEFIYSTPGFTDLV